MFDGTAIWGPTGPVVEIVIKSFQYPTRSSYCWVESSPGAPVVVRAAAIIEKPQFYLPFKVQ
jgi:hypothetical protein